MTEMARTETFPGHLDHLGYPPFGGRRSQARSSGPAAAGPKGQGFNFAEIRLIDNVVLPPAPEFGPQSGSANFKRARPPTSQLKCID